MILEDNVDDEYDPYEDGLNLGSPSLPPANDPVRPNHYKNCSNGAQVADICDRLDWNRGSAVKYIARAGEKLEHGDTPVSAEIRDLNKAKWHVERRLALVRGELEADSDPAAKQIREILEAVAVLERNFTSHPEIASTVRRIRDLLTPS